MSDEQRCGYCRWWKQVDREALDSNTNGVTHQCEMLTDWPGGRRVLVDGHNPGWGLGAGIYTHADFGCILWEKREDAGL